MFALIVARTREDTLQCLDIECPANEDNDPKQGNADSYHPGGGFESIYARIWTLHAPTIGNFWLADLRLKPQMLIGAKDFLAFRNREHEPPHVIGVIFKSPILRGIN